MGYQEEEEKPKKEWKFPTNMAECADRYYTLQKKRYKAQAAVKVLAEEENALEEWIIVKLPVSKATGIAGKIARISVDKKEIPQVKDWPKFYAYLHKNKAYDLLNRALNAKAVKERWAAGKTVPGTDKFIRKVVSVNKLPKKGR